MEMIHENGFNRREAKKFSDIEFIHVQRRFIENPRVNHDKCMKTVKKTRKWRVFYSNTNLITVLKSSSLRL